MTNWGLEIQTVNKASQQRNLFWKTVLNDDESEQESTIVDDCQLSATTSKRLDVSFDDATLPKTFTLPTNEPAHGGVIQILKCADGRTSTEKLYPCPECHKCFKQSSNQKKHIRQVHLKLKPFLCDAKNCGKRFSQKSVVRTHFKTVHMGERPFECPKCVKTFSDKSNMRKHVRNLHFKEKRYVCLHCSNKFGEKRSLHDHVNCVHLKLKPYVCPVPECSRRFGQKTHMSKHFRTRHENAE